MNDADIPVSDPFGAARDPAMPFLARALDAAEARARLSKRCKAFIRKRDPLRAIRVTRYKPGRRCVVEYDFARGRCSEEPLTLLGKVRARSLDQRTPRLLQALRSAGFDAHSADGVSVPEVAGVVPEFQMWLQRKVPGVVATDLLQSPAGVELARRVAEAAHKIHRTPVPTDRRHTMADELRILHELLPQVGWQHPALAPRLERLVAACDRLGAAIADPPPCGIHRDFYPAQVLVEGARLWLLDFDWYCQGDPAVDAGNFLGHLTEQALRRGGDPAALADPEQALEERYVELSGEATRAAVRGYATLTLARHVYLSTQFPEREAFTERLLGLCEQRLAGSVLT